MPPYRFRLEAVRRVREARRDELRGLLADAYLAADKLAAERRRIEAELGALRETMQRGATRRDFDVGRLLDAQRYELVLKSQLQDLAGKVELVEQEAERRRTAVVAAERDVKALDSLDRRDRERHAAAEAKLENKQLDEAAGVAWTRRTRAPEG